MGTVWSCFTSKRRGPEVNNSSRGNDPLSSSSESSSVSEVSKIPSSSSSSSSSNDVEFCLETSDHASWSERTDRTERTGRASDRLLWSERTERMDDSESMAHSNRSYEDEEGKSNKEIFERLRLDPKFSEFFSFSFPDMTRKGKIAEGAQAEIFKGEFTMMEKRFPCVLKVFKGDYSLKDLQFQFPYGMLKGGNSIFPGYFSGTSSILGGMVLEDDRFAIVLRREWGDLRNLIELRSKKNQGPPFVDQCAKKIIFEIAMGMRQLHKHGILHRDLKSYNVLVSTPYSKFPEDIGNDAFDVKIFDFESSLGVVGTGFWKAPEIMQALKNGTMNDGIFSTKTDVYSFAITCFEILTGQLPFEGRSLEDYDIVFGGERPQLPHDMDDWLRALIEKCWHATPLERPEFEDIVKEFQIKYIDPRTHVIREEIEASKSHWSHPDPNLSRDDLETDSNWTTFTKLKLRRQYSSFFRYAFNDLELGRKIAEGGQAEIFEGEFSKVNGNKVPCIVKLFKSDFRLLQLQYHLPLGMLNPRGDSSHRHSFGFMGHYPGSNRTCEVLGGVVFKDSDRFAFILPREGGDLRKLIDLRMKQHNNPGPPFEKLFAIQIMYEIALGMQYLHDNDILHRDLKAANVLVTNVFGEFPIDVNTEVMDIKVADYECSMLVVGTKFWRAPEILRQLSSKKERLFTRKADVYSYGMTCYEVLTGGVPLEDQGYAVKDYDAVYRGARPKLPHQVDHWLRHLIKRCWHSEPPKRPDFKEILAKFRHNCPHLKHHR